MYKWDEMSWRKKNALVAEKVMGGYERFVYSGPSFIYYGVGVRGSYRIEDNFRFNNLQWDVPTDELELGAYVGPNFTSDISAAWEVVEHFDGYAISKYSINGRHRVILYNNDGTRGEALGQIGQPLAEIACLAALRAVGVEIE